MRLEQIASVYITCSFIKNHREISPQTESSFTRQNGRHHNGLLNTQQRQGLQLKSLLQQCNDKGRSCSIFTAGPNSTNIVFLSSLEALFPSASL